MKCKVGSAAFLSQSAQEVIYAHRSYQGLLCLFVHEIKSHVIKLTWKDKKTGKSKKKHMKKTRKSSEQIYIFAHEKKSHVKKLTWKDKKTKKSQEIESTWKTKEKSYTNFLYLLQLLINPLC